MKKYFYEQRVKRTILLFISNKFIVNQWNKKIERCSVCAQDTDREISLQHLRTNNQLLKPGDKVGCETCKLFRSFWSQIENPFAH